jgi:hypothetical protein
LAPLVNARAALVIDTSQFKDPKEAHRAVTEVVTRLTDLESTFAADLSRPATGWSKTATFAQCAQDAHTIRDLLSAHWWGRGHDPKDRPLRNWCRNAEKYLATFVLLFFRETLSRLIDTLMFVMITILLLVAAQSMSSFHPRQALLGATWIYAGCAIGTALYVFVSMEHNRVLSLIANTTGGAISWDRTFLGKLTLYALVPLATLFAAQFPQFGDAIMSWLGPARQALPY